MKEMNQLVGAMLFGLAKLCRFNAFAGAFLGFAYSQIARLFDWEFLGLGPTQIMFLGMAVLVVFFLLSIGLTMLGNLLLSDVGEVGQQPKN